MYWSMHLLLCDPSFLVALRSLVRPREVEDNPRQRGGRLQRAEILGSKSRVKGGEEGEESRKCFS
jgi:hypothetical protein